MKISHFNRTKKQSNQNDKRSILVVVVWGRFRSILFFSLTLLWWMAGKTQPLFGSWISDFAYCWKAHYKRFTKNFKSKVTWLNEATATSPRVFGSDTSSQPNGKVVLACQLSVYFLVTPEKKNWYCSYKTTQLKHLIILFENKPPLHLFVSWNFVFSQNLMGQLTWSSAYGTETSCYTYS